MPVAARDATGALAGDAMCVRCTPALRIGSTFARGFDLIGLSYKPHLYAEGHVLEPGRPVFGSETASTVSSRGEYFFPVMAHPAVPFEDAGTAIPGDKKNDPTWRNPGAFFATSAKLGEGADVFQVGAYDLFHPPWATTPELEFESQDRHPFVLGEFVWTGFDYLGEPTPYDLARYFGYVHDEDDRQRIAAAVALHGGTMPSRSSYFGIFDLCGFRKDRFFLYQARWRPDLPMAHLLPHWNWPERIGQVTPVHVYTSGDEAELFLNGRSLGRKMRGPLEYRLRWDDVKFEPGEVKVIAYKAGREWATDVQRTTGTSAQVALTADRTTLRADGRDLAFVTVSIRDKDNLVVPRAGDRVRFSLTGPGDIVAVDNGDARRLESFQAKDCRAFNGLCLLVIRTRAGKPGLIVLQAEADDLKPAATTMRSVVDAR